MKVNSRILVSIVLVCLYIVAIHSARSQIYMKPNQEATFDRSNSILVIHSLFNGSFFLNDYFLLNLKSNDTAYITNVIPGKYIAKLITNNDTLINTFSLSGGKVFEVKAQKDTLQIKKNFYSYEETADRIKGRTVYFFRNGSFYNITQISFCSWDIENPSVGYWFRSFTTINGIQAAPGFCTGIGISYDFYPSYVLRYSSTQPNDVNIHFLPVFLDIRTHFPPSRSGRTFPFFKFDIGCNFPLTLSSIPIDDYGNKLLTIKSGGIYISPGFGYRIFLNKLLQITASFEFAMSNTKYDITYNNQHIQHNSKNFSFLKICLGVGFQYKRNK